MSDQKRRKQSLSTRTQSHSQIKSASSSSSALSYVEEASENGTETSKSKTRSSGRSNRRSLSNADSIKKIVQEEGRIARNLVTWNVPLENTGKSAMLKTSGPSSPVKKSFSSWPQSPTFRPTSVGQQKTKDVEQGKISSRKFPDPGKVSGSSTARKSASSKKDIRARYWAYLFENLHRAVDEIYQTCESDESVVECKEVIMMLDQYRQDFNSLIERLHLMQDYEKGGEGSRRKNLAWEVRKRSPSKSLMMTYKKETLTPTHGKAARTLLFTSSTDSTVDTSIGPRESFDPTSCSTVKDKSSVVGLDGGKRSEEIIGNDNASESNFASRANVADALLHPHNSNTSTWADRVRSLKNTRQANSTMKSPEKDVNVAKKPHKIQDKSRNGTNDKYDTNKFHTENKSIDDGSTNCSNDVSDGSQILSNNSVVDFPSLSGQEFEKDQDGWETVHRGSKQKQKMLWPLENSGRKGRPPSLSSKSLHSIPSIDATTPPEVQLSSSSPFLFASRPPEVILGLPPSMEREVEGMPLSIDTSVFNCQHDDGSSRQVSSDGILTTSNFFAEAAEPNSEVIFANCYRDPVVISSQEGPRESKTTSPEVDDEELDKALMDVLKEEDNLENLLDEESEAALESAMQEEKTYLWQIEREEMQDEQALKNSNRLFIEETSEWEDIMKKYEEDLATRKDRTWGEQMEEARTPGRLVHVFEKLSSPSRKRLTIESRQQLDEKQAKAAELREKTLLERGENLRMLRKKVEEIQSLKNELMNQARLRMEKKLQRAEEKRQILLQMKVKKAHEEDTKANEIAFINTLEAQNKRHEIMAKHQESEARLQDMQEERQRKHEEKAAKEAAAEERRKALEAERMSRLQEMQDRRRQRETDFEQRQQEREKERVEAARARDREREERLAALNKQQQAHIEELQKKIQQKQDETDRRHKEKLEAIQEKAFRMSLQHHSNDDDGNDAPPKLAPYEKKKFCSVCNVLIPSEVYLLSHLRGKTHQQAICDSSQGNRPSQQDIEKFNLQHISDAPVDRPDPRAACEKERQKAFKKRCKKLKLRMIQRSSEYEASIVNKVQSLQSQHKNKMQKVVKDLQKCINVVCSGPWAQSRVSSLDRSLGEICRIFEKNVSADKITFKSIGGLTILFQLLEVLGHPPVEFLALIPNKSLLLLTSVLKMTCLECPDICQYLLLSNKICTLIDLISQHLNMLIPDDFSIQQTGPHCKLIYDQFVGSLVELSAAILLPFADESKLKSSTQSKNKIDSIENKKEEFHVSSSQAYDVVSYIVSVGILDKISVYFNNIRGSIDGDSSGAEFLQNCLVLVTSLVGISTPETSLILESKKTEDPTQLILTLKATQLVGIVSLMYGILLHSDAPARGNNPPPCLPKHTLDVAFLGFRMLNQVARLNMSTFQSSLGEEGTSLEFRHIASYLLWYCNCCSNDLLLHEVILCVGHFALLNSDNQLIIQSGQPPTILQQLCFLPFRYFSDPKLTGILFPTLICCCFKMLGNKAILEQELSCVLLSNFLEENSLKGRSPERPNDDGLLDSVDRFKQFYGSPINRRMCLAARFPRHLWQEAQLYFSSE